MNFRSVYQHGFARVAACTLPVAIADPPVNAERTLREARACAEEGVAVALFPEGTSYTEPRIMQVKDGAAWAALEYTKWARAQPGGAPPVMIVPVSIVYTNKSKYRSRVIME